MLKTATLFELNYVFSQNFYDALVVHFITFFYNSDEHLLAVKAFYFRTLLLYLFITLL